MPECWFLSSEVHPRESLIGQLESGGRLGGLASVGVRGAGRQDDVVPLEATGGRLGSV